MAEAAPTAGGSGGGRGEEPCEWGRSCTSVRVRRTHSVPCSSLEGWLEGYAVPSISMRT